MKVNRFWKWVIGLILVGLIIFVVWYFPPRYWSWQAIIVSLPLWLLAVALFLIIRSSKPPADIFKTSLEGKEPEEVKISFEDVGGLEEAKEALTPIIEWLKKPQEYLGIEIPRGILITGPSGTGKTLLARAIAGQATARLLSYTGAEFNEILQGMGSIRMRKAFADARKTATDDHPCIVFIDQIDLIGAERLASSSPIFGAESEIYKTLAQLLAELDNLKENGRVYVIAATSRPRVLDPALTGPGRLSVRIDLKMPNTSSRKEILTIHMRGKDKSADVDLGAIAANTEDFSGAELEQLVKQANEFAKERTKAPGHEQSTPELRLIDFENAKGEMLPHPRRSLPQEIVAYLDQYVTSQEKAKKRLAVAVSNHYLRLNEARGFAAQQMNVKKSNVLMIGPTGSGKTMLVETIADFLDVPYVIFNSTVLTETGYSGASVEQILYQLIVAADLNLRRAEYGIVCIDEFDKLAFNQGERTRNTGSGVQQELLKIIEGTAVDVPKGGGERRSDRPDYYQFNTKNILFICLGAFVHIEKIIEGRLSQSNGMVKSGLDLLKQVQPEDVINYGFIPELIGRFPIITFTEQLTKDDLVEILNNPKNGLVREYKTLLAWQGWQQPQFTDGAIDLIAREALKRRVGARGLRGILEEATLDRMYLRPENKAEPQILTIDDALIREVFKSDQIIRNPLVTMPLAEAALQIQGQLGECLPGNALVKKTLAVTSYGHYRNISDQSNSETGEHAAVNRSDSNPEATAKGTPRNGIVLLLDPYLGQRGRLVTALADIWRVPLTVVQAELLERNLNTRTGQPFAWLFEPVYDLLKKTNYNLEKAQQGILFIDGFDKVVSRVAVNPSYISLPQQLCEVIQGNKVPLKLGNGREIEFKTENLFIVLGGDFLFPDKRSKLSQEDSAYMARYEPASILSNLRSEFSIPSELLQLLIAVPLDLSMKKEDLDWVIQNEDEQLKHKYQDMIAYTSAKIGCASSDHGQLSKEAQDKSWKISDIRQYLESKLLEQIHKEQEKA